MRRLAIAALALAVMAAPAAAQVFCLPRDSIVEVLSGEKWREQPRAVLVGEHGVIELHGNADTGTWTLFLVRPDGEACPLGEGEGFELLKPQPRGPGKPS